MAQIQEATAAPQASVRRRPLARVFAARVPIAWVQIAVLLASLAALPLVSETDPDFWWHLRTGQLIAQHGIPRHDIFSWTAAGQPWVDHEWLSELVIYGVETLLGYWANVLLFGAVTAAALVLMYRLGRLSGASSRSLVLLMFLSVATFTFYVTVRPQEFSWLLFAVFVYVIERDVQGHAMPLWLLPALAAVWANLHLGFVYGLMAVGLWCVSLAYARTRGRPADLRRASVVLGACVLATMLNPHGPALLAYPVQYALDHRGMQYIAEWRHPSPLDPLDWPALLTAAILAWAIVSRRRPGPFLLLVSAATIVLSLQAIRNAPFAELMLLPVAGGALARRGGGKAPRRESAARVALPVAAALVAAVVAAILIAVPARTGVVSGRQPSQSGYPAGVLAYLRANDDGARVFNEYSDGGYFIAQLYPAVTVAIDGRDDVYGGDWFDTYAQIYQANPGWQVALARLHPDVIAISSSSHLAAGLRSGGGWRQVFAADGEVVFVPD